MGNLNKTMKNYFTYLLIILITYSCKQKSITISDDIDIFQTSDDRPVTGMNPVGKESFKSQEANNIHTKGLSYVKMGKFRKAKRLVLKALELEADNPVILNSIALIEMQQFNFNKSEEYFLKIFDIDSTFNMGYMNIGLLYYHMNRYERSITYLKKVDFSNTNIVERHATKYHLCMAYTGLGNCDSSLYYYNLAKDSIKNDILLKELELFKREYINKNCP